MLKKILAAGSLILIVLLIVLNYYFPILIVNVPEFVVPNNAIESYRHLRVGAEYERAGRFEEAEKEYLAAALAKNSKISQEAQYALRRVIRNQKNPALIFRLYIRSATEYIVVALVTVFLLFWLLLTVRFLLRRPGYSLLSIDNNTTDNKRGDVHSLLYIELQRIKEIYSRKVDSLQFRFGEIPMVFLSNSVLSYQEDLLNFVDNFFVLQNHPISGRFLRAALQLINQTEYVISGNIFQAGAKANVYLEIMRTRDNIVVEKIFHSIEARDALENEQLEILINDLAYKLIFSLSEKSKGHAQNWRSFQLFTKALECQSAPLVGTELGQDNKVIDLLLKAIEYDPTYSDAEYLLGIVYSYYGQNREARQIFQKLKNSSNYSIEATYHLGVAFLQEHQKWASEKAKSCFEEVIANRLVVASTEKGRIFLGLSYCGVANTIAQQLLDGNIDVCLKEIDKQANEALSLVGYLDEIFASIELARGTAFMNHKLYPFAIDKFKNSILHYPYNATAYVNLAKCHMDDNPEEAEFWLNQALKLIVEQDYIRCLLGLNYERMGWIEQAKKEYQIAVKNSDAQNRLGEIFADETNYDQALECFKRSITINSQNARAWGNLAWWAIQNNQAKDNNIDSYNQIIEWARRSLTLNTGTPFEWLSHDTLGLAYFYNKEYFQAEVELKKSIIKKDDKIQNRYHLALLYKTQAKIGLSVHELHESLSLKDKSLWRDKAQELLVELNEKHLDKE